MHRVDDENVATLQSLLTAFRRQHRLTTEMHRDDVEMLRSAGNFCVASMRIAANTRQLHQRQTADDVSLDSDFERVLSSRFDANRHDRAIEKIAPAFESFARRKCIGVEVAHLSPCIEIFGRLSRANHSS